MRWATRAPGRRGTSLGEAAVALALSMAGMVLCGGVARLVHKVIVRVTPAAALGGAVARIREELSAARGILLPSRERRQDACRPYVVYWDPEGALSALGVCDGVLRLERWTPEGMKSRELARGVDFLLFDHRRDIRAVRYQVALGSVSAVGTVRPLSQELREP